MVKQIAFFVEGEEDPKERREDRQLRKTFHTVFQELGDLAAAKGIGLKFRLYGSRRAAFEKFCEAVTRDRTGEVYHVLLVDSEAPVMVAGECWGHVNARQGDGWVRPAGAGDDQCHLMVEAIEGWLLADREALRRFYGDGFRAGSLPDTTDVEQIPKTRHISSLEGSSIQ